MMRPEYRVVRSHRKTMALHILPDGTVEVRCPKTMSQQRIHAFVEEKTPWIMKKLQNHPSAQEKLSAAELKELTEQAKSILSEKLAYYAPLVGVTYGRVTVRHQKTRWGSCSAKGNLNFNCLLVLAPSQVQDYVIVHELCHIRHLNHSAQFWALVETILPDYAASRKWLKVNGTKLIGKLP